MLKKYIYITLLFCSLLFQNNSYAWGYMGHMVIANIAYNELNPKARDQVDRLNQLFQEHYPQSSTFVYASIWADWIKKNNGIHTFDHWHYINLPYSQNQTAVVKPARENVVWAIQQSRSVLRDTKSNDFEKALFLHFLIHFVGDVHQPLHCITLYNRHFPKGDKGGILYPIKAKHADNLHEFWDRGLGMFQTYHKKGKINYFTNSIMHSYPPIYFKDAIKNSNVSDWAKQCHAIAIKNAYTLPMDTIPSENYIKQGQEVASAQMALAGYRLAYILNSIWH